MPPRLCRNMPLVVVILGCGVVAQGGPSEGPLPVVGWDQAYMATRAITIQIQPPPEGPVEAALRVTLVNLHEPLPPNNACCPAPDFSDFESSTCTAVGEAGGCARWVGPPFVYLEAGDLPGFGNYRASRLQCTPLYRDWGTESALHAPATSPRSTRLRARR